MSAIRIVDVAGRWVEGWDDHVEGTGLTAIARPPRPIMLPSAAMSRSSQGDPLACAAMPRRRLAEPLAQIIAARVQLKHIRRTARLRHNRYAGTFAAVDAGAISTIVEVRERVPMLQSELDAYQLIQLTRATEKVGGAIAEVGVYQGATAELIAAVKDDRPLHLFDTFEGLPEPTARDSGSGYHKGAMAASLDAVAERMRLYQGVRLHKGVFPDSSGPVAELEFGLVHIDVDLYESCLSVLEFFYPRMLPGGTIVCHDQRAPGPRAAIDEFLRDKPEIVIRTPGAQAILVRLAALRR